MLTRARALAQRANKSLRDYWAWVRPAVTPLPDPPEWKLFWKTVTPAVVLESLGPALKLYLQTFTDMHGAAKRMDELEEHVDKVDFELKMEGLRQQGVNEDFIREEWERWTAGRVPIVSESQVNEGTKRAREGLSVAKIVVEDLKDGMGEFTRGYREGRAEEERAIASGQSTVDSVTATAKSRFSELKGMVISSRIEADRMREMAENATSPEASQSPTTLDGSSQRTDSSPRTSEVVPPAASRAPEEKPIKNGD